MKIRILIVFCVLSSLISQVNAQKSRRTVIDFAVPQLQGKSAKLDLYIDNIDNLEKPTTKLEDCLIENGRFKYNFNMSELSSFGIIFCGKALFLPPLFAAAIEPGDSLHIEVADTTKAGLIDLKITGMGSEKLNLLKEVYKSYMAVSKNLKPYSLCTPEELYKQWGELRIEVIDSAFLANKEKFKPNMYEILHAQAVDKILESVLFGSLETSDEDATARAFRKYILDKKMVERFYRPGMVQYLPYTHKVLTYIALIDYGTRNKVQVNDLSVSMTPEVYSIISNYYSDMPEIKNYLLAERLVMYLKVNPFDDNMKRVTSYFLKNAPKGILYEQVRETYDFARKTKAVGTQFYNFSLTDANGREVKLSDFKGKKVFLDFWFTGCQPCKLLVPTLKMLEDRYKDKNIVFLSISIDRDFNLWKKNLKDYSTPNAIHLYTNGKGGNHELISMASIIGYPTLILIDEDGKLEIGNLVAHKQHEIIKALDSVLARK